MSDASVTLMGLGITPTLNTQGYLLGDEQAVASRINLGFLVTEVPTEVPFVYVSSTYNVIGQTLTLGQGRFRLWSTIDPDQPSTCSGKPPGVWTEIDT